MTPETPATATAEEQSAKTEASAATTDALAQEKAEHRKLELEDKILRYFQNKEIAKERAEENKLLFEEIEQFFEEMEEDDLTLALPNGEYAVLAKKAYVKDVFDKDALAQELLVAKDELKTPFDFSMFTAKGKLTPDMISKHTVTETVVKVRLSKRKTKPRKKKS